MLERTRTVFILSIIMAFVALVPATYTYAQSNLSSTPVVAISEQCTAGEEGIALLSSIVIPIALPSFFYLLAQKDQGDPLLAIPLSIMATGISILWVGMWNATNQKCGMCLLGLCYIKDYLPVDTAILQTK